MLYPHVKRAVRDHQAYQIIEAFGALKRHLRTLRSPVGHGSKKEGQRKGLALRCIAHASLSRPDGGASKAGPGGESGATRQQLSSSQAALGQSACRCTTMTRRRSSDLECNLRLYCLHRNASGNGSLRSRQLRGPWGAKCLHPPKAAMSS
jgi:hypothetical protein